MFSNRLLLFGLFYLRLISTFYGIISDCDEVFNYWEPLNFMLRGFGKQTWEYSPEYAIRSWSYLVPLWIAGYPPLFLDIPSYYFFYFFRLLLVIFSLVAEVKLYHSLKKNVSSKISFWYLLFTTVAPGMSHSTIALLPSSFAMVCHTFAIRYVIDYLQLPTLMRTIRETAAISPAHKQQLANSLNNSSQYLIVAKAVFWYTVGGLLGWPFALALALPFAITIFVRKVYYKELHQLAVIGALSVFIVLLILAYVVQIDSICYNKTELIPLNIVLYNVLNTDDSVGPDIFGTEPVSYYILNLLLNFNFLALLGYASLPLLLIFNFLPDFNLRSSNVKLFGHEGGSNKLITLFAPLYLWSVIFFTQPHKEERFLYPIYPLITLGAAFATHQLIRIPSLLSTVFIPNKRVLHKAINLTIIILFSSFIVVISVLRVFALISHYSAPLFVYQHLDQFASDTPKNVCVGREWYHYPSSFFLPPSMRLRFVRSGFSGMLPGDFDESVSRLSSMSNIPRELYNNKNLFESDKVIPFEECDFYVDISKAVDSEQKEIAILAPSYSDQDPAVLLDDWSLVHCDKFIDQDHSRGLGRILYLPKRFHRKMKTNLRYQHYCLLKKKSS
ncbi:Alpha-1,2 mannosyltransferase [Komagataella phaffii CBS 7435]|uniref:Mannosyltransferase n=2 Tax=Komagataella phaffii TaxID=460519 RepID=C4R326_KOMPG|nr:Mannosyltransferase, involved in N-linked glycosylation [Komagataella phaffii GS115]AOA62820.1 GQ67_01321T0 [Komagataella phaffii]CAH2447539.1 Alpha-1,2 mannosyltransferase [Komagataella phaffii CBS 7435]AOA67775.1 GQ68_00069T0 [Komagataella phaffii GS115]CAY69900.1 Mannosyltransferase, involved in N-linked glycosylation [Komagataella phaffii GS115]CCA37732.2 Alpha-1,2 mannosyltransferase [Komagataella phaffii CBS 7435]